MTAEDARAFTVVTLNLRHMADRWRERLPLVRDEILRLAPDAVALQEVNVVRRQARQLARAINRRLPPGAARYRALIAPKTGMRGVLEGLAILTRLPVREHERIGLRGGGRVVQRARLALPGGAELDLYNTHLHHAGRGHALRCEQALRLLGFIASRPGPAVLAGDLNAAPGSPPVTAIETRLRSAHAAVHGHEPERTVPAPLAPRWPDRPEVIDYILAAPILRPVEASVVFDHPHPADPRLSPSDHYGLVARFLVDPGAASAPGENPLFGTKDLP